MEVFNFTPKCDMCVKRYPIIPGDSHPAMMGFEFGDKQILNICYGCICSGKKLEKFLAKYRYNK